MAAFCKITTGGGNPIKNVKSVTFREAVNSGVDLRPGCVASASIEVEVFNTQPNAVPTGTLLTFYLLDKNGLSVRYGKFIAEPVIATKNSYKIVAYDYASKLNADFSAWLQANQASFPMTVYALVSAACTVAGVTLGQNSWTLSTKQVQAFYADNITCRDIISYAAELGGLFAKCGSNGQLVFSWYSTATNKRIYPSSGTSGSETRYAYKQNGLSYTNYDTTAIDGVAVHPSGEDDVAYVYPIGASGNILHITNNLLLTGADASFYNDVAQAIYNAVTTVGVYRPATAKMFPKETPFKAGEIVAVTDAQGVSFNTVIMEATFKDQEAILSSTGNEKYSDAENDIQKAVTQLNADVVRINRLKVDWAEINQAFVNYLTANNVTAQNLEIVDENGNVLATYDSNGITLGQAGDTHAELDFNSFSLIDRDGTIYFTVGDFRNQNGEATVTLNYISDTGTTIFMLVPECPAAYHSTVEVKVNGSVVSNYTVYDNRIVFSSPTTPGDAIVIKYTTSEALYSYTLGTRANQSNSGAYSVAMGKSSTASGYTATVAGGLQNKASGQYSFVGGGQNNQATGVWAVVAGGQENKANLQYAFVGGGYQNYASSQYSSVLGGSRNEASGLYSSVLGGSDNDASGSRAAAIGYYNKASGANSFVFGKYNVEDLNDTYAEIVGNGTSNNYRSNARTLDWSGNETLAGGLTLGTPLAVGSGGTGVTTYAALLSALGLSSLKVITGSVNNNANKNFTVGAGHWGILMCGGANASANALYTINTTSNGAFTITPAISSSGVTVSENGSGIMNIANSSGSQTRILFLYV